MHRFDSDSSLALKRKKSDLEALHQNFLTETFAQQSTSGTSNLNTDDTSAMITDNIVSNSISNQTLIQIVTLSRPIL